MFEHLTMVFTWIVTAICLLGTILNIKKSYWCFVLWIIGNVCWMAFDLWFGLFSRFSLDVVQLGFAIWGLIEWRSYNN